MSKCLCKKLYCVDIFVIQIIFIKKVLEQRCPTLSPFATCGNWRFKCGDRRLFRNVVLMTSTQHFYLILTKVATAEPLLPQLCRKRDYGWTPLYYNEFHGLRS
jgi:hypothetical protein